MYYYEKIKDIESQIRRLERELAETKLLAHDAEEYILCGRGYCRNEWGEEDDE